MPSSRSLVAASRTDWCVSVAFWVCLFVSAGLYAIVGLSPRFRAHIELETKYVNAQHRLVALEDQIEELEKVEFELANNPAFAAELARLDFDAFAPGEEHISVETDLTVDVRDHQVPEPTTAMSFPWYAPALRVVARDRDLRNTLLGVAVCVIIFAFTFLHESQAAMLVARAQSAGRGLSWMTRRYRKQ